MSHLTKVEADDPYDYQQYTDYFYQCQRFFEIEHADEGDKRCADPGPDRIGDADIYFLECEGQAHKRKTVKYKNQY